VVTNTSKTAAAIGILVFLALSTPVFPQQHLELQFGVRAGVPLTNSFASDTRVITVRETVDRTPVTVGPTFEAVLYDRFLIQLDAMYRSFRGRSQSINPPTGATFELRAASFEFPVVFDYVFSKRNWRPYAGVGMVAGHVVTGTIESHLTPAAGGVETPFEGQFFLKNQLPAYVANGGLQWNTVGLAIRPEVRYTHWHRKTGFETEQNQVEISVGFSLRRSR